MAAPLPDTDGDLVLLALEGRQDAFSALYERYFPAVFDFLTRLLRNREEAADVAQDTFIKALEQLGSLKNPERFKSWLFTIAHRRGLNRIRSSKRTTAVGAVDDDERATMAVADADPAADPEQMAAIQQAADIVWEAAALLDPRTYTVMDLHVRQGLDSAEIAEVMGVTKGNAYTMVSRMKQSFSNTLATYLLVRKGRQDCDDLAGIVEPDVTKMTPELRRKADRHVAKCSVCSENKAIYIEPVKLFAALMLVPVPAGLKASIWGAITAAGAAGAGTATAATSSSEATESSSTGSSVAGISPTTLIAAAAIVALLLAAFIGANVFGNGPEAKDIVAAPELIDGIVEDAELTSQDQPVALGSPATSSGGTTGATSTTSADTSTPGTSTTVVDLDELPPPGDASSAALVVVNDTVSGDEDTTFTVDVAANDAGPIDRDSLAIVASPSNGSARTSNGVIAYTPRPDFAGSDQLTYSIADTTGRTERGVVTVTVRQVNDEPVVPGPGVLSLDEDASVTFKPLQGAVDIEGDTLTVAGYDTVSTAGGTVSAGGTRYTPPSDFSGADSFSYTVSDGQARVDVTVAVTVAPLPDPPTGPSGGVTVTVTEDAGGSFDVLAGWTDPDGDPLTVIPGTFTTTKGGKVVIAADGTATYTPPEDFSGTDSFSYTVTDGENSTTATATITVTGTNDAPSVQGATLVLDANAAPGTVVGTVVATDPDAGDTLTFAITAGNTGGQLRINSAGSISLNALTNASAFPLTLTVEVTDAGGLSDTATVRVELVDSAGPSVTNFAASPTTIRSYAAPGVACPTGNSNSTISAKVTDPVGVASVSFSYQGTVAGLPFNGTIPTTYSGTTATGNFAVVIGGLPFSQANFNMTVTATDNEGNTTVVGGVTVTVLPCT